LRRVEPKQKLNLFKVTGHALEEATRTGKARFKKWFLSDK
jgi:hypothetical protein